MHLDLGRIKALIRVIQLPAVLAPGVALHPHTTMHNAQHVMQNAESVGNGGIIRKCAGPTHKPMWQGFKRVLKRRFLSYTVFTLELLYRVRCGTVRCDVVRAYLHCSAQFRIPSNKRGGAQVKVRAVRMNELRTPALAPSWMCSSCLYLSGPALNDVLFLLASLHAEHVEFTDFGS